MPNLYTMNSNYDIKFTIHEYLDGNLNEEQIDKLWAELLSRPEELEYLETLASLKSMGQKGAFTSTGKPKVHTISKENEQVHIGILSILKPYLVAASILIAGMLVLYNAFPPNEFGTSVTPITSIEYDIVRSAEVTSSFESYLQGAVNYAALGNIDLATQKLNEASNLELSSDQEAELEIVRGSMHYNLGEFQAAAEIFSQLSDNDQIDVLNLEKALWYLANSQLHLNEIDAAKENIIMVIDLDGAYSRIATNMLSNF
ncbi:MAG: hypothetical protein EA391_10800 [Balneolaceae bacterium]|nr:MAG: hypothetical protein EA391_10800 [Balneolaceae bacterium]